MKNTSRLPRMLRNVTIAGLAGAALRLALYRVAFDDKNLMPRFHYLHTACLALALAVGGCLLWCMRRTDAPEPSPGRMVSGRAACCLGGVLLALYGLTMAPLLPQPAAVARMVLAFAAGLAMLILSFCRISRRGLLLTLHGILCIVFLAEMVFRYRSWSGNPQLPDYVFHVLACAALALGSYYRMAAFGGLGKPRLHLLFSLMACFLCLMSLVGPEHWTYYLAGALWSGPGLLALQLPEEIPEAPEED